MAEAIFKVKIKPELTPDARRFIDGVKKDLTVSTGGRPGVSGGGGLKGLLGPVLGTALVAIVGIANSFKGVLSILGGISKLISELLRPIADVIFLLLRPILEILKPIMIVVRQVMAPFRKIAFQLSSEGAKALRAGDSGKAAGLFAASIGAGLAGVSAVITVLFKDIIKLTITGAGELLAAFVDIIFPGAGDRIREVAAGLGEIIDGAAGIIIETNAKVVQAVADRLGVDLQGQFLTDVRKMIDTVVTSGDNSIVNSFRKNMNSLENSAGEGIDNAFTNIGDRFENAINGLASRIFNIIDSKLGGFLPGGVTPSQVRSSRQVNQSFQGGGQAF